MVEARQASHRPMSRSRGWLPGPARPLAQQARACVDSTESRSASTERIDGRQFEMGEVSLTLSQAFDIAVKAYNAGKLAEVEQICLRIIAADPDSAAALNLLAVTYSSLGGHEKAIASYDRALALRPDFIQALVNRGIAHYEMKRFGDALASYDSAIALRPDHAEALVGRGLVLHDQRRFDEALDSYDRALALRPDDAEALVERGAALHELGRPGEALKSFERALVTQPDHAEALTNRGVVLHDLARHDAPDGGAAAMHKRQRSVV